MTPDRPRRAGFTLIELIVATSIFVLVLAAAWSIFDSGRNLTVRAEARSQLLQTVRAAFKAISDDLKGAVMPNVAYDTGFVATDSGAGDQSLDKVEFISENSHPMPRSLKADEAREPILAPRADLFKVTYWVEPNTEKTAHGLVRYRQQVLTPVSNMTMKDEDIEMVAPEILHLNLRYYDTDWQDSWDSTQLRKLPKAVEITVYVQGEWRGEKFVEKHTTQIYLAVAAETPEKTP